MIPALLAHPSVLTPHIGFVSVEDYRIFYGDAVEDISAWLAGSPVRTLNEPRRD